MGQLQVFCPLVRPNVGALKLCSASQSRVREELEHLGPKWTSGHGALLVAGWADGTCCPCRYSPSLELFRSSCGARPGTYERNHPISHQCRDLRACWRSLRSYIEDRVQS